MATSSVLIVDDDAELRSFLSSLLVPRGFRVQHAARLSVAWAMLAETAPDVLIVDGLLPDGTGIELISRIREAGIDLEANDGAAPRMKIIFISAFWRDLRTFRMLTEELRVDRVINKPFLANEFLAQLDAVHGGAAPEEGGEHEHGLTAELARLRQAYVDKLAGKVRELEDAVRDARARPELLGSAHRLAHRLHGTAGAHGLSEVSSAAAEIETGLRHLMDGRLSGDLVWRPVQRGLQQLAAAVQRRQIADAVPPSDAHHAADLRLLVVDAAPDCLAEAAALGRKHLVQVFTAQTVEEAMALADSIALDGAIIGLESSRDERGFAVARALRGVDGRTVLPIAFLSADGAIANRVAAVYAGSSLFLPRPLASQFAAAVESFTARKRSEQPRVLVVDDDASFTRQITTILESEGMAVGQLSNPLTILEALQELQPEVLLLDVAMPDLSGYDVCKMLRAMPEWHNLLILFLTARLEAPDRLACFQAGGDDYLPKPMLGLELLERIRVRVERARIQRERASRDGLTGLLSRQAFIEAIEKRLAENRRLARPLSLCLLDLDHFKQINDLHGHLAGDRVLRALGKTLQSRFRVEDLRGRWGGEEFVVAFNGEGSEASRDMLRRVLEELRGTLFQGETGTFSATFSAGVALFPDDGLTLEELLRVADRRLYAAKERGRNQIET